MKTGSSSASPIAQVIVSPFFLTMTPCSASGIAPHWYFLMPPHPVGHRAGADRREDDRLAAVVVVDPVARQIDLLGIEGLVARRLRPGHDVGDRLALGLAGVEELLVGLAERLRRRFLPVGRGQPDVPAVDAELLLQQLARGPVLFIHSLFHLRHIGAGVVEGDVGDVLAVGRVGGVAQPLLGAAPARVVGAEDVFHRAELVEQDAQHRRAVFDVGRRIEAVLPLRGFAAPLAHLHPVERVGHELHEPLRAHI